MKKNILLVNPWIHDFKAYDSWVKPLGLLYIGSILESFGYEVYLLDCLDRTNESLPEYSRKNDLNHCGQYYREEIPKPEILKFIHRKYKRYGIKEEIFLSYLDSIPAPDIILVTSYMTYWYPGVLKAVQLLKKRFPYVPVILGGIYATLCFSHARQFSNADFVWSGAFNQQALNLINSLSGDTVSDSYDFNNILEKRPAYHLYNKLYSVAMLTSLGCPYNCSYCASKMLQPVYFTRHVSEIIKEIESYYYEYKISHIAFYDDALLFNSPNHIEILLDKIIEKKMKINFYTPNGLHARFINLSLAKKMKECGFSELRISLETSDPILQKTTGGKIFSHEFSNSIDYLKEAGFKNSEIGVYIMVGLPEQKYQDIVQTIKFVQDKNIKIKLINFSPLPGSKEWMKLPLDLLKKLEQEPLWQNDIAYLWLSKYLDWDKNQELKNIVNQ